jgi:hypothetical protein
LHWHSVESNEHHAGNKVSVFAILLVLVLIVILAISIANF